MGIRNHGPKLEDANLLAIYTNAFLTENGASRRVEAYRSAQHKRRNKPYGTHYCREPDVKGSLDCSVSRATAPGCRYGRVGSRRDEHTLNCLVSVFDPAIDTARQHISTVRRQFVGIDDDSRFRPQDCLRLGFINSTFACQRRL